MDSFGCCYTYEFKLTMRDAEKVKGGSGRTGSGSGRSGS